MKFKSAIGLIFFPVLLLASACAPAKPTAEPNLPTAVPASIGTTPTVNETDTNPSPSK